MREEWRRRSDSLFWFVSEHVKPDPAHGAGRNGGSSRMASVSGVRRGEGLGLLLFLARLVVWGFILLIGAGVAVVVR